MKKVPTVPPLPPALARGLRATFSTSTGAYVVLSFPLPAARRSKALSPTERAVAAAVLAGLSNAEIARRRGTSPRTVANQLSSIYGKLGVCSRIELARALTARRRG